MIRAVRINWWVWFLERAFIPVIPVDLALAVSGALSIEVQRCYTVPTTFAATQISDLGITSGTYLF